MNIISAAQALGAVRNGTKEEHSWLFTEYNTYDHSHAKPPCSSNDVRRAFRYVES